MKIKEIISAAVEDENTRKRLIWSGVTLGLTVVTVLVGNFGQKQGWWEMEFTGRGVHITPVQETEQAADAPDFTVRFANLYEELTGEAEEASGGASAEPVAKKCPTCGEIVGLRVFACPSCGNAADEFIPLVKCPTCGALHEADDTECPACGEK